MRFQGNIIENLQAASESKDKVLLKEILVDSMANLIEEDPTEMVKVLKHSNVDVDDNVSKRKLIDIASYNLYNNPLFHKNLAVNLVKGKEANENDYASAEGDGSGSEGGEGGGKGAAAAGIVSSIAGMLGSIGAWGASSNDLKKEELRTQSQMYEKIFGEEKKTNWMPIIVIGGVLLIGAIVVWRLTAKK